MNWANIAKSISNTENIQFTIESKRSIGGGCINDAWHISGNNREFFVKLNHASSLEMFEAELEGLNEIHQTATIRVPRPIICGTENDRAFLVMEYISMSGHSNLTSMGEQLAAMHRNTSERFGWRRNNTIGSTPQLNDWKNNWIDFWRYNRLGYQIKLAAKNGIGQHAIRLCEELSDRLDVFFQSYQPQPSLLHGDLWSGNASYDDQGNPVIFDPACYYGDREADLAMTELFGGFGSSFFSAYNNAWPVDPDYSTRKALYNHYHILNHYNLFGGSYGAQAERMAEQLLAECR